MSFLSELAELPAGDVRLAANHDGQMTQSALENKYRFSMQVSAAAISEAE
jgi:hypothetical protein